MTSEEIHVTGKLAERSNKQPKPLESRDLAKKDSRLSQTEHTIWKNHDGVPSHHRTQISAVRPTPSIAHTGRQFPASEGRGISSMPSGDFSQAEASDLRKYPESDTTFEQASSSLAGSKVIDEHLEVARERTDPSRHAHTTQLVNHGRVNVPRKDPRQETPMIDIVGPDDVIYLPAPSLAADIEPRLGLHPYISPTIHILGSDASGKFLAHHIAELPFAPPVTLLLHRPLLMQMWHDEGASIRVLAEDGKLTEQSSFKIESCMDLQGVDKKSELPRFGPNLEDAAEPPDIVIDNLIVTTPMGTTISALQAIKHRLRHWSTVCFVHNGLGIIEQINSSVFPDLSKRPNYMMGTFSHVLQSTDRMFSVVQRRKGAMKLLMPPRRERGRRLNAKVDDNVEMSSHGATPLWAETSRYMMATLCRHPRLNAVGLGQSDFFKVQLERLVINAVIGPLSVMFNCSNEHLLYNYQVSRIMVMLLYEIEDIMCNLPELDPSMHKYFLAKKLEGQVLSIITRTGKNTTSMLHDVRAGRRTDIEFYNGYIVKRGAALGIPCPLNEMLIAMVKGKQTMKSKEKGSYIPFQ